jgi:hypothetical protein
MDLLGIISPVQKMKHVATLVVACRRGSARVGVEVSHIVAWPVVVLGMFV